MASTNRITPTQQRFRRQQENEDDSIPIAIFDRSEISSSALNGDFLWFQLFIEVLLRMKDYDKAKEELVGLCYQQYESSEAEKRKINEFASSYVASDAVKWCTRDSFVYRILNRALRQKDMDILYAFRCVIIDIHHQLQCLHAQRANTESVIHLYRGQSMSRQELERIQVNVGNFVSMSSFLSTSIDRHAALIFAEACEGFDGVLFDLRVDMTLTGTKPFADVISLSYYRDEEEVLFMLGAIFRICKVTFDSDARIWTIELNLCSDADNELKPSLDSLKEQIDDETNLYEMGRILWKMGQLNASERCFKQLLQQEHSNVVIIPGCYLHLGNIANSRGQYEEAIVHHRYALELKQKTLPPDHPHLAYSHNSLGEALREHGDFDEALVQYKNALTLWQQEYGGDNHENVAMCLHNIGTVHGQRDELQEALKYFTHALQVMSRCLPTIHPNIARTLKNIGSVLGLAGKSERAREVFQQALAIQRRCLPSTHPHLAETLRDLGICCFNSGHFPQALSYYQQAAAILHQSLSLTHPLNIQIQEDIEEVETSQASLFV